MPRPNFGLWFHKVQISIITGRYAAAAALLKNAPGWSALDHALCGASPRTTRGGTVRSYEPAIAYYREVMRFNPGDAWAHFELSRAALMNLDVVSSRAALVKFGQVSRLSLLLKGQSLSSLHNYVGQLIDEVVLDAEALAALRLIRLRPLQAQFEPLRELIQRFPILYAGGDNRCDRIATARRFFSAQSYG